MIKNIYDLTTAKLFQVNYKSSNKLGRTTELYIVI